MHLSLMACLWLVKFKLLFTLQDLSVLVESSILHKQPGIRPELEATLYENKSSFTQLLKNPPRNEADASLLRKATTEGNI